VCEGLLVETDTAIRVEIVTRQLPAKEAVHHVVNSVWQAEKVWPAEAPRPNAPRAKKPFFQHDETGLKQMRPSFPSTKNGDRHDSSHPELDLPAIHVRHSSRYRRGKAMTEAITALFAFFSISIFLAHAFDAYRSR
jgi:hypothetical protein